ncbi:MAG: peptidoglycan-binding protein [Candidatus Wildermuthbacteria bacterium]|nr:peptidoglycan-binding protein [Candidatus Wildermuthbacteria bacterium]
MRKFPTLWQWLQFPKVLSNKEKIAVSLLGVVFVISSFYVLRAFYYASTHEVPARGGTIVEGIVGSPRLINPVFSDANDADRDLVQLVFAGLATYDEKNNIVPDLAKEIIVQEGGKTFEVTLRDNLKWQDGFPLTSDDVFFTVATIQDPRFKSPVRANWVGVEVEKVSGTKVLFKLKEPYAPFLERLTLKILPAHIWQNIGPENFAFSSYNIKPVGSGPYKVGEVARERSGAVKEIRLETNVRYHGDKPFIGSFAFRFFATEKELQEAIRRNEVRTFVDNRSYGSDWSYGQYRFSLPRYFAVFFNLAGNDPADPVKKKEIRQILANAVDRETLAQTVQGVAKHSLFGNTEPEATHGEDEILALFEKQGYKKENGILGKIERQGGQLQRDLEVGSTGADVETLQECLANPPGGGPEIYPQGTVSGTFGTQTKQAVIRFQEKYSQEILAPNNLKAGNGKVGPSTREKLNELCFGSSKELVPLAITLSTVDQYPLKETAQELKEQWGKFGIAVDIKLETPSELERNTLKPRNFQALLFGEITGTIADLFPFWHSSQKRDPGLNLSSYENKNVDSLLEKVRKELDEEKRNTLLKQMEDILLEDAPALFLFDMPVVYVTPKSLRGVSDGMIADPSWRFSQVSNWYFKTKRAWGKI